MYYRLDYKEGHDGDYDKVIDYIERYNSEGWSDGEIDPNHISERHYAEMKANGIPVSAVCVAVYDEGEEE